MKRNALSGRPEKPSLYGLDLQEAQALSKEHQLPGYRGKQLLEWLYKKNIASFEDAGNLPKDFRKKLAEQYSAFSLDLQEEHSSANGESTKYLFKTHDGRFLECVLIAQRDRRTLCVSSQLGCKIGCTFCASGKGAFGRDLTAGEILEQVILVERRLKKKVTNIVFMGMGEPLDNFEATMKALKILQASWGLAMGSRRITVSTSGITPKILEFVQRSEGRVRLSVSLHSSDQRKRSELVPINKRYMLQDLMKALRKIHRQLKRDITFEYTLIEGVNDSADEAEGVARLAKPLNAKLNVIPYNPIREMDFKRPDENKVKQFCAILEKRGIHVIVRQTAGRDINAACGQLRLDREKTIHS